MKKFIFVIISFSLIFSVYSTPKDTISVYNIKYSSDNEKILFEQFIKTGNVDLFSIALCIDSTLTTDQEIKYRNSLTEFLKNIKPEIEKAKNEKAKISKIIKKAHLNFFNVYDIQSNTGKLYKEGVFNCVTGSLFFTEVLDSLHIPFLIKEMPTHVYLLAYPEKFSIPVESTDTQMQIFIPDSEFKKNYVDFLVESKLILKTEVQTKGIETVFNEKYYSQTNIKPIELVGLLYYNSGTEYLNSENYKKAFQEFEKAYVLYPSDRIRYAMEISLLAFISDKKNFTLNDLEYLGKLSSYSLNPSYDEAVIDEFKSYTYKYLINGNNEEKYNQIYNDLYKNLIDSTVKADISFIYFWERGRTCMLKQRINEGWKCISKAYQINPVNIDLIDDFKRAFHTYILQKEKDQDFITYFDNALIEFNVLKEDQAILETGARYFLKKATDYLTINDFKMADKTLTFFEDYVKKYPQYKINEEFISGIYSALTSEFYRNGNIKQSNVILKRGLKIMPGNAVLIRKYKINISHEIN